MIEGTDINPNGLLIQVLKSGLRVDRFKKKKRERERTAVELGADSNIGSAQRPVGGHPQCEKAAGYAGCAIIQ